MVPLSGDHPFYIDEEDKAHGLGCLDMKGGVVMAIWITRALQSIGWNRRPIKLLFVGDEKNGHQRRETKEFLLEHGVAVCLIGVRRQFNHFDKEYALVESLFKRAKLLATAILRMEDYAVH